MHTALRRGEPQSSAALGFFTAWTPSAGPDLTAATDETDHRGARNRWAPLLPDPPLGPRSGGHRPLFAAGSDVEHLFGRRVCPGVHRDRPLRVLGRVRPVTGARRLGAPRPPARF